MPTGAVIGAAAIGAVGSNMAADKQADAAGDAAAAQLTASREAREFLQPFKEAGEGVLGPLQAQALNDPFNLPFERQEGFRSIQNSAAAGGKLRSGGTLAALADYETGMQARFDQQRFGKLYDLARLGSNAAAGQATGTISGAQAAGNFMTQAGNAQAAGIMGIANAANSGLQNYMYLQSHNNGGG